MHKKRAMLLATMILAYALRCVAVEPGTMQHGNDDWRMRISDNASERARRDQQWYWRQYNDRQRYWRQYNDQQRYWRQYNDRQRYWRQYNDQQRYWRQYNDQQRH
ncbi:MULTISPECIES: hypothetical protein [Mycetohabitans]|uniref:hypothetical protein n=1 Tax=Mycetohabitans TaxID=2571159 RepID=UPI0012FF1563|nr:MULTISPECIES: hypothetical protein [Mycetohabitans]MCG1048405.1 hypothetical protein [Mycetohabitans sp. B6]